MDKLFLFLSSLRWQDVVDIALNSYILFRLYAVFRGTIVFRVLVGIAFVWFFQRIAVSLGLILASWVLQGITAAAAFIIIVIFRNEIRAVLQAKTLRTILWGVPHQPAKTPVQTIAEALYELAQRHVGALIVFPGKDHLEEVAQSGKPWHGLVSKEMIMSIFWHDNPVHDGAAIIQGDRVTHVGVILPLSHRDDLPSHYATRHRAAAGLAETTDALVVLVSEETGDVAVAKGSQIRVIDQKEELVQTLREHLGTTERQWGYLRREKLELAVAALVSVALITAAWFSFARGLESLVTLEIPIEYMNRDPEMEIVETSVNTVRLDLSGSGALMRSIGPEQVRVKLDLSRALVGRNTFAITPKDIDVPPGVILREIEPPSVGVALDVVVKKELAVQLDWVGKLPEHLVLTKVTVTPDTVTVIGGEQTLKNISTIYTERIRLDHLKRSGTVTAKLALHPPSLKIATGSKDSITAQYVIEEK